jgi:hypothetical protein
VTKRVQLRIALGAAWLLTLAVVVQVALATRPDDVGTQDGAGLIIIAFTLPAIVLAIWQLRRPVVVVLTFAVAAAVSSRVGWSVLFDSHSTAAVGVIAPGISSLVIVASGVVLEGVVRRLTSP